MMKKRYIPVIFLIVFAAVFLYSGCRLIRIQLEYRFGENAYAALEDLVVIHPAEEEAGAHSSSVASSSSVTQMTSTQVTSAGNGGGGSDDSGANGSGSAAADDIVWPEVDFEALRGINDDIVAWIYIDGTSIHYPVVQGEDNDYYMYRLFDGTQNDSGCIFLDSRNADTFLDRNSILYGHHMKNGSMFYDLDGYKTQEFYETHPVALLLTPQGDYQIQIFASYVTNVNADVWRTDFTGEEHAAWLKEVAEISYLESDIVPQEGDRVITLATCSYEFSNARLVVLGVLKERE